MNECDFRDYEHYCIEEDADGRKSVHILGYVWCNRGERADDSGVPKPYTLTSYIGARVPVDALVACDSAEDRRRLIEDCEEQCSQTETDCTWDELRGNGCDDLESLTFLQYADIGRDTPVGHYYCWS